jgi:uncharacterized membrane protein
VPPATSEIIRSVATASALTACGLSAWIWSKSAGVKGLPGCGKDSACAAVTKGRWSRWGPISVAGLGSIVYLVLTAALATELFEAQAKVFAFLAAMVVIASAIWFISLQLLVIRRLCVYCMVIHAFGCAAAILALVSDFPSIRSELPIVSAMAAAFVLVLVAGQLSLTPKTFAVIDAAPPTPRSDQATSAVPRSPSPAESMSRQTSATAALITRKIPLFRGRVAVDTSVFPIIGAPNAPLVLGYLLDYTCRECHHMQRLLYEAIDEYGGKLAIALIPVPLHHGCNPHANCPKQERIQACWYARMMFAVWMTSPDRFGEWDRFMAAEDEQQPFGFALAKATELADIRSFRLNEADERLDASIAAGIKLYEAAGKPAVPSLVLPGGILRGHVPDKATLLNLLRKLLPAAPRPLPTRDADIKGSKEVGEIADAPRRVK